MAADTTKIEDDLRSEADSQVSHHDSLKDILTNKALFVTFALSCLNAMGVVYGDIGTSVLYVFKSVFENGEPTPTEVKGALCVIIYSITWVVCIKYLVFVLMADYRGEGGVFALVSLILHTKGNANPFTTLNNPLASEYPPPTPLPDIPMKNLGSPVHNDDFDDIEIMDIEKPESAPPPPKSRSTSIHDDMTSLQSLHRVSRSISKLQKSEFLYDPKVRHIYAFLSLIGAGLLLGDGVITPAISVLSAFEGLELLDESVHPAIVPLTVLSLICLFMLQRYGTAKVGVIFGPAMLLWFFSIAAFGIYHITENPSILEAFNPYYGYEFFRHQGYHGWVLMGAIVLCVTGCEAMYADMGHFGKTPVRASWILIVYPSLLLNYIGQGAHLIKQPSAISNPFFSAVPVEGLRIPMVILSTVATIIASQALISGAFSITQQAINLGTFPRMKVIHTSDSFEGQIYIPTLNYMLMAVSIVLVIAFESSTALSNAYGLAVCGDMTLTTLIFCSVARFRWRWHIIPWSILLATFLFVDSVFLTSTLLKIPYGGWVPLIIAFVVTVIMYTWRRGKEQLNLSLKHDQLPFGELQHMLRTETLFRCKGAAIFLSSLAEGAPVAVNQLISHIPYLPEIVVFLTVRYLHIPYVKPGKHITIEKLPEKGFFRVIAYFGYKETSISMHDVFNECAAAMPNPFQKVDLTQAAFFLSTEYVRVDKSKGRLHRTYINIFKTILQLSYSVAHTFKIPNKSLIIVGSKVHL